MGAFQCQLHVQYFRSRQVQSYTYYHSSGDSPGAQWSQTLEVQIDDLCVDSLQEAVCGDNVELSTGRHVYLLHLLVVVIETFWPVICNQYNTNAKMNKSLLRLYIKQTK